MTILKDLINGGLYQVRPKPHNRGYLEVGLYRFNPQKGKKERKWIRIHQLVANAFIPKPADSDTVKYEPNHRNGPKVKADLAGADFLQPENPPEDQDRGGARQHYEPVLDRPFESGGIRSLHKPLQALITVPLQELQGGQERPQRREQELEESQHETVVVGEVPRQHKECLGERHEHCGDERKGHHRDELPHHAGDE